MRKVFFWSHLVIGLTLGLVILSMCLSGSVLAFEPQLIDWSEREFRNVIPPNAEALALEPEALTQKAKEANPTAKLSFLIYREKTSSAVMAGYGREGILFLNPYTGEVLGKGSRLRQRLHQVEEWHRWLGNRAIGKPITGAAAIAFFLLSLSGIYLWWPRRIFSLKGTGHGRNWNWHNTFGVAAALFILVITSTGIAMSYDLLKGKGPGLQRKPGDVRVIHQPAPPPKNFRGWITPMHTGRAWGIPGQTINFLVSVAGFVQIWTGFALAYRRFRPKKNS